MTEMTKPPRGWTITRSGIHNPAGFFLRHKMAEFALSRDEVMAETGKSRDDLEALLDPHADGCMAAPSTLFKIVDMIIQRKADNPELVWDSDRIFFTFRKQSLIEGLDLLAQHKGFAKDAEAAASRFNGLAAAAGSAAYIGAVMLFSEAAWGSLDRNSKVMSLHDQLVMRRHFGNVMLKIEADPRGMDAFDEEARELIQDGDIWSAMNLVADRLEAMDVARRRFYAAPTARRQVQLV